MFLKILFYFSKKRYVSFFLSENSRPEKLKNTRNSIPSTPSSDWNRNQILSTSNRIGGKYKNELLTCRFRFSYRTGKFHTWLHSTGRIYIYMEPSRCSRGHCNRVHSTKLRSCHLWDNRVPWCLWMATFRWPGRNLQSRPSTKGDLGSIIRH